MEYPQELVLHGYTLEDFSGWNHLKMEGGGRKMIFRTSIGWFLGSILIFQGVMVATIDFAWHEDIYVPKDVGFLTTQLETQVVDTQKFCWCVENTPWKINMEHNHGGLEDHFPFQMGDF